jgi:hypothetical protein
VSPEYGDQGTECPGLLERPADDDHPPAAYPPVVRFLLEQLAEARAELVAKALRLRGLEDRLAALEPGGQRHRPSFVA